MAGTAHHTALHHTFLPMATHLSGFFLFSIARQQRNGMYEAYVLSNIAYLHLGIRIRNNRRKRIFMKFWAWFGIRRFFCSPWLSNPSSFGEYLALPSLYSSLHLFDWSLVAGMNYNILVFFKTLSTLCTYTAFSSCPSRDHSNNHDSLRSCCCTVCTFSHPLIVPLWQVQTLLKSSFSLLFPLNPSASIAAVPILHFFFPFPLSLSCQAWALISRWNLLPLQNHSESTFPTWKKLSLPLLALAIVWESIGCSTYFPFPLSFAFFPPPACLCTFLTLYCSINTKWLGY